MVLRGMAAVAAAVLLGGCSMFSGSPSPLPAPYADRAGVDRQATSGLATERRQVPRASDGEAIDESRGSAIGSIVPPGSSPSSAPPPPVPAAPAPATRL